MMNKNSIVVIERESMSFRSVHLNYFLEILLFLLILITKMAAAAASSTTTPEVPKVIALLDIDSFECQVWQRFYPEMESWGKPCVVVDQTGRITSATYEAKAFGISRDVRIGQAKALAKEAKQELQIFDKPNDREKPDSKLTRYASWEILDALKEFRDHNTFGVILEYSSSDEFYLDITEQVQLQMSEPALKPESNTFLEGEFNLYEGQDLKDRMRRLYEPSRGGCDNLDFEFQSEKALVYGALLMQEISTHVFKKTRFVASVGIGSNKLMAKLAVSLHRPGGITALPEGGLRRLGSKIPLEKIPGLGGKTGGHIKEIFQISTINELRDLTLEQLEFICEPERARDIYSNARGISDEPVKEKLHFDDLNCGKNFYSGQISTNAEFSYQLQCLVQEVLERLEEEDIRHIRVPTFVRVKVDYSKGGGAPCSSSSSSSSSLEPSSSWTFRMERNEFRVVEDICNSILGNFLREIGDIANVNVTRICLSAKAFVKLVHSAGG